jgi:antitoxin component YwqK of YwqJK toxin-antitoxin module
MKKWIIPLLILLAACAHHSGDKSQPLTSIQMVDRNGFSETVSANERLSRYQNVDFLAPQPYQKVLRVYRRDHQGKTHAILTCYHPNGQVSQYLEVVDSRAHGFYREWYENGKKKLEARVIEGIADFSPVAQSGWLFEGESHVWDEEGKCIAKILYSRGALEGVSHYFYPSGKIQKEIPYRQNEVDGVMTLYAEDGNVLERISHTKGERDGLAVGFWKDRKEKYTEHYEKGALKEGVYFSPDGTKIAEVASGAGKQVYFDETRLLSLVTIARGFPDGPVQLFGENGEFTAEYHVKDGKKHGEEIQYYPKNPAGKLLPKLMVTWHDDKIHGVVKTWYENGAVESQREMSANKKHGMGFAWYKDSSLMLTEEYESDKLIKGSYFKRGEKEAASKIEAGKGVATLFDPDGMFVKKINYDRGRPLLENQ